MVPSDVVRSLGWSVRPTLATIALMAGLGMTTDAQAARLQLGDVSFEEVSGNFQITGGSRSPDFYTLYQDVTGPDVNLLMRIEGFEALYEDGYVGIRVQSIVRNLTGTPWIFFDHELREEQTIPSPEADGLSFAQGYTSIRPFTSDLLPLANEVIDVRDFVNFSGGVVQPGQTVTFLYAITDNSPDDRFFLLQRPNFQPGGVGFVNPTPPAPEPPVIPPPVVEPVPVVEPPVVSSPPIEASPPVETPPVVVENPPVEPLPEPTNVAAVPEPTTIMGAMLAALSGIWFKQRQRQDSE
ncbi:PEP-CTERM sorting domain-containing protein [Pantanalinema sp. GBBB05]|uniref:PEP-CTERM sorting domain-containing protein n=1 Tax=Pantanalinema sp. GBBB05 TaxID=2604139 RepID=UPI001DD0AADF|nr:PEP-CTERM sorting domain-containing protein [Pantanalinema sp. GBBB05]